MLFVFSGPTGVGKDTIINNLIDQIDGAYRVLSTVTRAKRPNEQSGYRYVTKEQFFDYINKDQFLEYVQVHGTDYYGTLKQDIIGAQTDNLPALKILDVVGYKKVKDLGVKCVSIFIGTSDKQELKRRIIERGENLAAAQKRLERVDYELSMAKYYDYVVDSGSIDYNTQMCKDIILKHLKK